MIPFSFVSAWENKKSMIETLPGAWLAFVSKERGCERLACPKAVETRMNPIRSGLTLLLYSLAWMKAALDLYLFTASPDKRLAANFEHTKREL